MKRSDFVRYLQKNGCKFMREGSKHSIFWNSENDFISTVPRHTEIDSYLTRKICKDLGIPAPKSK